MRILVLSDIHGNWPALRALEAQGEQFDLCFFLGDAVDYGLEPTPVIDWLQKKMTCGVRGNHDHGAAQKVQVYGSSGYRYLTAITRPLTIDRIQEEHRLFLRNLPTTYSITLNNIRFLLVHATPRDPLDEFGPVDVEFWRKRLEGVDSDFVLVGHTHIPYALQVSNTIVLNPGSVGLPRDGDPRGSYAIITEKGFELKRFEYPVDETIQVVMQSPLPEAGKNLLAQAIQLGRMPHREKKN